jgi:glycoside/pentoside/hexuronide:cation symporter, GPH family
MASERDVFKEHVPIAQKLAYSFANLGTGLPNSIFASSLVFFYNTKLLLGESFIGYAYLIFAIWNAVNDPLFGFISDKTKNKKLGRRIPYLRYGSPLYGLVFIFIWFPFTRDQIGLFINLIVSLFVFDTFFTMIGLVMYAFLPEMAFTQSERAKISLISNVISFAGIIISFLVPSLFLTESTTDIWPFQISMIVVAAGSSVIMYASSFVLKENPSLPKENPMGILEGIKYCIKNPVFVDFEFFNFILQTVWSILITGIFYYVRFVLGLTGIATFVPILFLLLAVVGGMVFFSAKIDKIGIKRGVAVSLAVVSAGFLLLYFFGRSAITAFPILLVMGFGLSGALLYASNMYGDICDYDEIKTGVRREGTYAGINALITKPAISIGTWLLTFILGTYGFVKEAATQAPLAIEGIMIAMTLVPAILGFLAVVSVLFYPVGGQSWVDAKKGLQQKHEQAERELLKSLRRGDERSDEHESDTPIN